jgi:uncharacterized membrane protein
VYNHGTNCTIQNVFDNYDDVTNYYNNTFESHIEVFHKNNNGSICDVVNNIFKILNYIWLSIGILILFGSSGCLLCTRYYHVNQYCQLQKLKKRSSETSEFLIN